MNEREIEKNVHQGEENEGSTENKKPMKTTYVGFPGSETLHTDANVEDQMKLERLEGSVDTIEEKIAEILRSTYQIKIRKQQADAQEEKKIEEETSKDDLREIAEFLELFEEKMYLVDYETINDERIPKDGNLYLAVGQDEIENLKGAIEKIGYEAEEKEGVGLEVEMGPVKVFFIYAK